MKAFGQKVSFKKTKILKVMSERSRDGIIEVIPVVEQVQIDGNDI